MYLIALFGQVLLPCLIFVLQLLAHIGNDEVASQGAGDGKRASDQEHGLIAFIHAVAVAREYGRKHSRADGSAGLAEGCDETHALPADAGGERLAGGNDDGGAGADLAERQEDAVHDDEER